ncbi:Hpt domain-containing protein [Patulibacter americanus]|uniref:Hpt domain-containing protein n=1 Tax=Patulibacter americanus TaxID=588672 RepID=UPI0003B53CCF|nr:Hpt domain-containing protein [Patulibacter americanus]
MAPPNAADGLEDALRALWDRTLPRVLGRIAVLDEAAAALAAGRLDDELCDRARIEAHRLAGTLGTMGLPDASPVAKRLERLLEAGPGPDEAAPLQDGARTLRQMAERGPA